MGGFVADFQQKVAASEVSGKWGFPRFFKGISRLVKRDNLGRNDEINFFVFVPKTWCEYLICTLGLSNFAN